MLENEIKALREAIEANTAALLRQQPTTQEAEAPEEKPKAKVKAAAKKEALKEAIKEEPTTGEKITSQMVKDLARTKMVDGVPRPTIKAIIVTLGAESIADLDDKGLATLHNKLEEL